MVVIAGLIVIGLIIYFIIVPTVTASLPVNVNKPVTAALPVTNTPPAVNANVPNVPPPAEVTPETAQASTARTIAIAFAERFATYSNQNDLANLDNLENITTPAVWSFIKGGYRSSLLKTMPKASSYYAMTSTTLNANVSPVSATEVSAKVMMQRVESGAVSKVAYATLDLKLTKTGDNWLVSWEQWEK